MRNVKAFAAAISVIWAVVIPLAQSAPVSQESKFAAAKSWVFAQPHGLPLDKPLHVPGSTRTYTGAELSIPLAPPDWFPQDHPPMPRIVARGGFAHGKLAVPCALCHFADGVGDTDCAALAGLPKSYIIEQVLAFRTGQRGNDPVVPIEHMDYEARNVGDADLQRAAAYYAKLRFRPRVQVVETATVPKTHWRSFFMVPDAGAAREPIGERIIEVPVNAKLSGAPFFDTHSGFIAYVPPGSIARGKLLAERGNGAAPPCESCHQLNLEGIGSIPPLAGRSPTYIVRELILFRSGGRTDPAAAPMRRVAAALTLRDMIDAAAYAASRKP